MMERLLLSITPSLVLNRHPEGELRLFRIRCHAERAAVGAGDAMGNEQA